MKNKLAPTILFIIGFFLLALVDYGAAHDTSRCTSNNVLLDVAAYTGIIALFIGLLILFRRMKTSWPLTIVFSVFGTLAVAIINGFIALSVSPGGILDCWTY